MEDSSPEVKSLELRYFKDHLLQSFNDGEWGILSESLDKLGELSEKTGQLELCLRAQTLKIWVIDQLRLNNGFPCKTLSNSSALLNDLLTRLDHLEWKIS